MGSVKPPKECLVCLNASETIFVSTEESQKIFNICCSYVKDAINVDFLIHNINANNNQISFCKNCFHSSVNISQLVEQLSKLKKEINDLANCFSETIRKQRSKAKAIPPINFENGDNTKFHNANNVRSNPDSTNMLLLSTLQSDSERDSFKNLEAVDELVLVEQIAIDGVNSEIVKTESGGIFPEYEDENCTDDGSGYQKGELETNYLLTGNENDIDPFGDIESSESTFGVNNCDIDIETKPQIATSKSMSKMVSSVTMPNILLKRIRNNDVLLNTSGTFHSDKACQNQPIINSKKYRPGGMGSYCNSTTESINVKFKTSKTRKMKYSCSICEKGFRNPSHLKRHSLTHTREKSYKCAQCEKTFSQSSNLKTHERLHTGEKPFKCSKCPSSFVRSDKLKEHEITHTEIKRYKCSNCVAEFKHLVSFRNHERLHTGETPFKCSYCDLKFYSKRSRLKHQRSVHPQI